MKAKFLVFFGIVAVGIAISLFTLTKCERPGLPDGDLASVDGSENSGPETPSEKAPSVPETIETQSVKTPASQIGNSTSPAPATVGNTKPAGNTPPALASKPTPATMKRDVSPVTPTPAGKSDAAPSTNPTTPAMAATGIGGRTPESVVGGVANTVKGKDFQKFMGVAGTEAVSPQIRERLKSVIENPNLELDPNRPFWEVAKTRDSVRWMLNFVPAKEGAEKAQSVAMDVAKLSASEYRISKVTFPPTLKEVVAAIENPEANPQVSVDSLSVAQAFSKAVLTEDFVSARKLCAKKVTDERIAGLMIALEEGDFAMREDRPLIVTFSRDTMSWILSRVNSPEHSSEFALELENNDSWQVNGLTFGKVIAALAKDVDGPYSPIVEDPVGGESLVVYFDFDDSGLTSRADNQLKIVANILKQDRSRQIRITGHADALGSDDYNSVLSSRRAESIRQGIIARGASNFP